ncbi:MAG: plastocyanin/azurin family copper-binding protein [Halobacteriales archaeon]
MANTRRDFLATVAGGLAVALAGCGGRGGETGGATDTEAEPTTASMETTAASMETTAASMETTAAESPRSTRTPTPTATPTRTPTETPTPTPGSASASVAVPGFEFSPIRLEVEPGTTVGWTNEHSVGHNVVSDQFHDKAAAWDFESATLAQGETTTYTFEESGVYEYYCSIHGAETMSGAVLVGDVSLTQTLPSEGGGGGY